MITTKYLFLLILITAGFAFILLYNWFSTKVILADKQLTIHLADGNNEHLIHSNVNHWQTATAKVDDSTTYRNYDEQIVIIYNRVPKTGSTSFVNLTYDLCKKNAFHVLHINITANMHVLSLPNQLKFVRNITAWDSMKPAFYHGHMAFLDFSKFSMPSKPLYINLIRQPLDRLVSYYYFLRYGDDYRPYLVRHRAGDTMTFDECVARQKPDCDPTNMWLQIPFFCGHHAECWNPGSSWALEQAKRNLVNEYFLVGLTEEMDEFIELLELSLSRLYKGAVQHFQKSNKSHLRKTKSKVEPAPETVAKIKESTVWQMENELYEFARDQFHFVQKKLRTPGRNVMQDFMYEKIKPNPNGGAKN
ncbi:heparin sulfate O-sulfotransferase [Anopheles maculipalpis]|uniref:heparin sulfate O-sulfotransferase n=1 Tax=Anopheles maculipalpis TaxID=1496333 RepID=UPI002159155E|nr:heparin sulfate O-sulfotransferase [Anopheles maculipalpis]